jgi:Tfp pilus assembly protein PilZ
MMKNRQNARFGPLVIKARIDENGDRREGYLTNVSTGGAFFAIEAPPELGAELGLSATMPWRLGELRARVRVVWRNDPLRGAEASGPPIPGVGLAFTDLEPPSRVVLTAYLARFAELAAQIEAQ